VSRAATGDPAGAGFTVRDSVDADIPEIAAIYAHHVSTGLASFEEEPPDAAEIGRRRAEFLRRGYPYLVAASASEGGVLGYAYASPYRARSAYRFSVENSVYVAPDQARRGIGGQLLAKLIERCTSSGFRQMIAVIGDSANAASIGLHEAHGFRRVGVLTAIGFKHGRWVDSVLMQLSLGLGASVNPDRETPLRS
jgi:phosphinothricin acetyltransferase